MMKTTYWLNGRGEECERSSYLVIKVPRYMIDVFGVSIGLCQKMLL